VSIGAMGQRPFSRLAIVDRGEAAMRAIHAVRELNWERSAAVRELNWERSAAVRELHHERTDPIRIIALHTDPDRHALFVRQADEPFNLGPATAQGGPAGYLDYTALERALTETRGMRRGSGWGFVAEQTPRREVDISAGRARRRPTNRSGDRR
jgi:biotin carboxylase